MYKALSQAAWGYFFLYFNINLGTVSILPEFVGWAMFLRVIQALGEERRDLKLLKPFAQVLILWTALDWLASWLGLSIAGLFLPLDLLVAAARLYFHFQFLTDCAAIAADHAPSTVRRLLYWRNAQTVVLTAVTLLVHISPLLGAGGEVILTVSAVVYLVVCLCVMAALFALRKFFAS